MLGAGYAARVTDTKHPKRLWLQPNWPAIEGVHALFTTRAGGHSSAPWNSWNLGDHVGDVPVHVAANRQTLGLAMSQLAQERVEPLFLQQVHGWDVQVLGADTPQGQAFDACVTREAGVACTVMVADCLPVLLAHRSGVAVAAAHAGWRGLLGTGGYGVLEATWHAYVQQLGVPDNAQLVADTQVWMGPCIGPQAFEVGDEVRQAFVGVSPQASTCFSASGNAGKWKCNLSGLARQRLQGLGFEQIYGNDASLVWCTVSNPSQFFSHRRDAAALGTTGRMAACICRT